LIGLNKTLKGLRVGDFTYATERLMLGDSAGNHFKIALRDVQGEVDEIMQGIKEIGQKVRYLKVTDNVGLFKLFWNATVWYAVSLYTSCWSFYARGKLGEGLYANYWIR
jgi:hypothetical protein